MIRPKRLKWRSIMRVDEIRIRDPFILTDEKKGLYYMYGTTALCEGLAAKNFVSVYVSKDLVEFSQPITVFCGGQDFWATCDYWAPEVYLYRGKYYMFLSLNSETRCRGTQVFFSDSPTGSFVPLTKFPVTPSDWECLDGTFYRENGKNYMVFCREWVQVGDGEIYAMQLSDDLSTVVGEPFRLFRASECACIVPFAGEKHAACYVTDGPFLFREGGMVHMLWSSLSLGEYVVLHSYAPSVEGKWSHNARPAVQSDGGHAMIFQLLNGEKKLALHRPNKPPYTLDRVFFR